MNRNYIATYHVFVEEFASKERDFLISGDELGFHQALREAERQVGPQEDLVSLVWINAERYKVERYIKLKREEGVYREH